VPELKLDLPTDATGIVNLWGPISETLRTCASGWDGRRLGSAEVEVSEFRESWAMSGGGGDRRDVERICTGLESVGNVGESGREDDSSSVGESVMANSEGGEFEEGCESDMTTKGYSSEDDLRSFVRRTVV
jgi:hypothetical protein